MSTNSRSGFAIVVVLLVSVITLLAFLFSTATLTIASRSSAAQERNATQALLAADSGLRTLVARASVTPFTGTSVAAFESYVEVQIGSLDLGDGVRADLEVLGTDAAHPQGPRMTVQSTGIAGTSTRVLVQEFNIELGPPIPARVSVPGALTSVGTIRNSSNAARIFGYSGDVDDWYWASVPACAAMEGEYVRIGTGPLYRVRAGQPDFDCTTGPDIELELVDGVGTATVARSQSVEHRPIATAAALSVQNVEGVVQSEVAVTDAAVALFGVNSSVLIGNNVGTVVASVGNVLTIEWESDPASVAQPEGTVMRRVVSSGVSANDCDVRAASFPDGCIEDANLDDLFFRTFGIATPQQMKDSLSGDQLITNSQIRDGRVLEGITWLSNPENNVRGQTGSGILIIENNENQAITLNVDNDFTGLIYIIGDANIQGNSEHIGAIIVDGLAEIDTSVQGSGDKIRFDPLELARALAGITFPNPDLGGLGQSIANSWRLR